MIWRQAILMALLRLLQSPSASSDTLFELVIKKACILLSKYQFLKVFLLLSMFVSLIAFASPEAMAAKSATPGTADWQTYKNSELNFSVRYPKPWRVAICCTEIDPITRMHPSGMSYETFQQKGPPLEGHLGTGKKVMVENYVTQWAIYNYLAKQQSPVGPVDPQKTIDVLISSLTKKSKTGKTERLPVSIAGKNATKIVLKKESNPDYSEEYIMLVDRNNVFVVHKINGTDESFNEFCKSLKFH